MPTAGRMTVTTTDAGARCTVCGGCGQAARRRWSPCSCAPNCPPPATRTTSGRCWSARAPEHVITNPDLGDDAENQARLRISHVKRHTVQITACDGEMVAHSRRLPTLRLSMACLSSCGGDAYRLDLASGQGAGDRNTRRAGSAAWQWRIGCPAPGGMGTVAVTGAESSQESWPTWGGSVNGSGNPA